MKIKINIKGSLKSARETKDSGNELACCNADNLWPAGCAAAVAGVLNLCK